VSKHPVERPRHLGEIERLDEQARVADLPAAAAAHEPSQLLRRRPSLPRGLLLEGAERSKLALSVDDLFHGGGAEGADQLVLEVGETREEPEPLHLLANEAGAEARPLEAAPEVAFLSSVVETRQPEVEPLRAEPLQEPGDRLRAPDRHDRDALGGEIPAAALGERFDRALVADPFDEHDRAGVDTCCHLRIFILESMHGWRAIPVCLAVVAGIAGAAAGATSSPSAAPALSVREYPVPAGSRPHDVAPARDGGVWYTAQGSGELGWLDPKTGRTRHIALGRNSAPHGVIVGPDGAPWITDSGLNAIVRVDPKTRRVRRFPLPTSSGYANLNTAVFDRRGVLWFTGQSGIYGRLDPRVGKVRVFRAPRGEGPYGITATPSGAVYYASLAGSYVGRVDVARSTVRVLQPPTRDQGARRVWSDSKGRIWVSEWNAGKVAVYVHSTGRWREWRLPGATPMPYAVYVDEADDVWLSDFGANALVRFDPETKRFTRVRLPSSPANVRQILGRRGEVWGAESGVDKLVVVRTR
jgi:virginiamycin B lyase